MVRQFADSEARRAGQLQLGDFKLNVQVDWCRGSYLRLVICQTRETRLVVLVLIDSDRDDQPELTENLNERIKRSLPGWKMLHQGRPHGTHKNLKKVFGGITVLWRNENV
jgi:hypothetical protein